MFSDEGIATSDRARESTALGRGNEEPVLDIVDDFCDALIGS